MSEQAAGTEPTDPRMLKLAREWDGLIEQFTGGHQGIRQSLATMYREQGADAASRGMVDPEMMQYVGKAATRNEKRTCLHLRTRSQKITS